MSISLLKEHRPATMKRKGHYMPAPEKDMPFKKYLGILEELGIDKAKCVKLTQTEIANG